MFYYVLSGLDVALVMSTKAHDVNSKQNMKSVFISTQRGNYKNV